jgi:CubicO group peptidase (beta-lactamase class C family)
LIDGDIPGAVIAVGRRTPNGYDTWQSAYGKLRIEPEAVPMPANAVFDLASMTKPIAVGTSLMILIERGTIGLDDPVGRFLPEFRDGAKAKVTVRNLMTHMSGLPPYLYRADQKKLKAEHGFPCPRQTRNRIRQVELLRPPGEAVQYSCLNAILGAEVVEAASGEPIDRFAANHVFKPLGMNDTGYLPPERLRDRLVATTRTDYGKGMGGFLQGQVHDPLAAMQAGVSGNAGLFSTADDLQRFAQMILNGGELDGVRILQPSSVWRMTRVHHPRMRDTKGELNRRGLMWDTYPPRGGRDWADRLLAFGHTGYTGTAIRFYPEQEYYVIALTNRVHPDDSGKVGAFRRGVWQAVAEALLRSRAAAAPVGDHSAN